MLLSAQGVGNRGARAGCEGTQNVLRVGIKGQAFDKTWRGTSHLANKSKCGGGSRRGIKGLWHRIVAAMSTETQLNPYNIILYEVH